MTLETMILGGAFLLGAAVVVAATLGAFAARIAMRGLFWGLKRFKRWRLSGKSTIDEFVRENPWPQPDCAEGYNPPPDISKKPAPPPSPPYRAS